MSYRLTPRAMADIEAIGDYIAQRSPSAALQLTKRLANRWELLATQPRSGALCEDVLTDVRHVVEGEYVTFYRVADGEVVVLRVLHGRRDITGDDMAL